MGGDHLHQTRKGSDPQQALADLAGVHVGQLAHKERPLSQWSWATLAGPVEDGRAIGVNGCGASSQFG
jgi:hypothetical protein